MGDIKYDQRNYRTHDERNLKLLKKSLKECGAGRSILIDANGEIIAGNATYKTAQELGTPVKIIQTDGKELIAVQRTDLATNDKKRKKLALLDNSTSDKVAWDLDNISADFDLSELPELGLEDLTEIAAETAEVVEDEVPTAEEVETRVKTGDIWKLGEHRLMCGDSTVITDVEKLMNGEKADMVFTDPPYNVAYEGKTKDKLTIQNDKFDTDEKAAEELWYPAFSNMKIVSQPNASFYMTMPQGGTHMMMMMKSGWQVKHELIWKKQSIVLNRADYNYQHEPILFGWNEKHIFYGKGKYKNTSVWEFDRPTKSKEHPTMKPIELIAEALLNSSKENDLIIDLFGGSGSTLIACEQLKRKCRIMEIDRHYCDVIITRWETLTGKQAQRIE